MNISITKKPSAWVPLAMSLAALALVLSNIAMFGVVREVDEGTAAHIWQILMTGQLPIIAFFAIRWLPERPKQGLVILILQIIAVLAACAPVFYFKL